jgi:hypothetical protein
LSFLDRVNVVNVVNDPLFTKLQNCKKATNVSGCCAAGWLVLCLLMGCGESAEHSKRIQESDRLIAEHRANELQVRQLTNLYSQEKPKFPATEKQSPEILIGEEKIELLDLNLLLRKIALDPPIDGQAFLYFSETEITNLMYASYLADTNQYRDDTALEKGSQLVTSSTVAPLLLIRNPESLWQKGKIPQGREDHPVSFLTISQGMEFCSWLNKRYQLKGSFRLPSDREWLFAAYGNDRSFPWGNDRRIWFGLDTESVFQRPDLRTPDGLYGMWGNVSELVLSDSNGYGGKIKNRFSPMITKWLGTSYLELDLDERSPKPRQDYWGYTHSSISRSDTVGFRIVFETNRKDFSPAKK